jgi:4-amino-4-deoxy-L-arabinose transferase-like glycosyltransferase
MTGSTRVRGSPLKPMQRSRAFTVLLAAALLLHGAIVIWALQLAYAALPPKFDASDIIAVTSLCLVVFWTMLTLWSRHAHAIAILGGLFVASVLSTPGVVAVVVIMLLNAHVVGARILAKVRQGDQAAAALPPSINILVGFAAWIGLMAITASMRIHYAPVYVIALLAPLAIGWTQTSSALSSLRQWSIRPGPAVLGTERAWTCLLLTVLVLHLFIVARPDVGYDANTMHLQFARLFSQYHRWSFEVTRYAWSVMPIGADYAFAAAYMLGGENAARLLNFCFGGLSCLVAYQLAARYARRDIALACVCLLASTPLAFLETGTLFVENLLSAFLLGALWLTLDYATTRTNAGLVAIAVLCAGAMQTKLIAVVWVAPLILCVGFLALRKTPTVRAIDRRALVLMLLATLVATWPYANAWIRTGNPVFPFMNAIFHSPYFDAAESFTNPLYVVPLRPSSIYELFVFSGRFIEGFDGAAGFHWLLLLAVIVVGFMGHRPLPQWLCLSLGALFFVVVFSQQAYLRYLFPFLFLITVIGAWTLGDFPSTRIARIALLLVGGILCLLNLQFMAAGGLIDATLCVTCTIDSRARAEYVATYLPDRAVAAYLNSTLPDARIGFFALNGPGASGYVGYSRAANWHDVEVYDALRSARSAEDMLAIARRFRLTHAVFFESFAEGKDPPIPAIGAFRDKYTSPVWHYGGLVVAVIDPGA